MIRSLPLKWVLRMIAVFVVGSSFWKRIRDRVVLPEPISPVMTTKPRRYWIA